MLIRFDPFREVDRLLQQVVAGPRVGGAPLDAYRRDDTFVAELDLPGVTRDSIDVTVERDVLTVTAERAPRYDEDDRVLVSERPRGTVTRRLYLGEGLDAERVEATYTDGVLRLVIPVAEEAKPHKIAINADSEQTAVGAGAAA